MNVFIIHGAYGNSEENWLPWLKAELEKLGCKVFVPNFPTPKNQTLENWFEIFDEYRKYLNEDTIIIGHSLGVPFLLSVLEKIDDPVKAAFFVSGFAAPLGGPFDEINKSFISKNFNWQKIRKNCSKFFVFHSNNDPYVSLKKAGSLADNLGVEMEVVEGAGHFNEASGYTKFDLILERIKGVL